MEIHIFVTNNVPHNFMENKRKLYKTAPRREARDIQSCIYKHVLNVCSSWNLRDCDGRNEIMKLVRNMTIVNTMNVNIWYEKVERS